MKNGINCRSPTPKVLRNLLIFKFQKMEEFIQKFLTCLSKFPRKHKKKLTQHDLYHIAYDYMPLVSNLAKNLKKHLERQERQHHNINKSKQTKQ